MISTFKLLTDTDITNFTHDDGDDDVTIGWYVDNLTYLLRRTYQPIVTSSSPTPSVALRKVRIVIVRDTFSILHLSSLRILHMSRQC